MKIRRLEIQNFRSIRQLRLEAGDVVALIGRNNSGKSNIVKALEILFEPSSSLIDTESFHNHDPEATIEVFATFSDLNDWEQAELGAWLDDGDLRLARRVSRAEGGEYDISTIAFVRVPEPEWLRDDAISGQRIAEWWPRRAELSVEGLDFGATLGGARPSVGDWKQRASEFVRDHGHVIPMVDVELKNPKGYPNVLKGTLPHFVYVPAVRDLRDETKVLKSNPFGRLISSVLEAIPQEDKDNIQNQLKALAEQLNRGPEGRRLQPIVDVEARLNELMADLMDCDVELEVGVPDLKIVFGETKIVADDGVRTSVDKKGHGLQRSMIVTILRHYAELVRSQVEVEHGPGRSTLIAMEEPELYLHPQAQRTLMGVLQDIGGTSDQVFYTTHSSMMVDVSLFDQIGIVRAERTGDGRCSVLSQLTVEDLRTDLRIRKGVEATEEGMRALYMHAFGPNVNDGFFAEKVVIAEGPSESYTLPIYARALGFDLDRQNVAVVHADGKGQMDRLIRLFNGFGIPTFAWFDGDKSNGDPEVRRKTLELLDMMGEPIGDIADLSTSVRPHYAVLEETLEATVSGQIDNYEHLVAEARSELGPIGKPLEHRHVAISLTSGVEVGHSVPRFIREIVEAIESLDYPGSYLRTEG